MTRRSIEREILAWIGEGVDAARDDVRFERLALALFRSQCQTNAPLRRICTAYGLEPAKVNRWQDIPAVPTGAFKEARLACFPPEEEVCVFRSSGSTTQRRGSLHLDTLELYRASALTTFRAHLLPDLAAGRRLPVLVLAADAESAPDSSLSRMFSFAVEAFGDAQSSFYVTETGWDPERAVADLALLDTAALVAGTAFAFVHLVDALAASERSLRLPAGTRVMETGGFKGRSRELARHDLHAAIEERLGVSEARIVNQYGMCELASQFYESTLRTGVPSHSKSVPPWVRTRTVDPETLRDVAPGESGALVHYDLANTGSVLAIMTSDEGRLLEDRSFEVYGRLPGAEERGCSIAADILLDSA